MGEVTLLLLVALLGSTGAMVPGMEYRYRYRSWLSTGFPKTNAPVAGGGLVADVTVQVARTGGEVVVKLSNVTVGDYRGEAKCRTEPQDIQYEPLQDHTLTKPFKVNLHDGKEWCVSAPSEAVWITNIRRAIAAAFRIKPLTDDGLGTARPVAEVDEDVLAGRCRHRYVMSRVSPWSVVLTERRRDEAMAGDTRPRHRDGYGGGRLVANVSSEVWWMVTRTADYTRCQHLAGLMAGGEDGSVVSRVSVGRYLVVGEDVEERRLEEAVLEGAVTVYTGKGKDHHLITLTNQSLSLVWAGEVEDAMATDADYRHLPCHHQFYRPQVGKDRTSLDLVLTGLPLQQPNVDKLQTFVQTTITRLAGSMSDVTVVGGTLATDLGRAVEAVAVLQLQEMEELEKEFLAGSNAFLKRLLFYHVVAGASTEPAITFLLDRLERGDLPKPLHDLLQAATFRTLRTNHVDPSLLPRLMRYIQGVQGAMKYTGLMNLAVLVSRVCLNPWKDPMALASSTCNIGFAVDSLIPYLKNGLGPDQPRDTRLYHIQALANLRSPHTLEALTPLVLGVGGPDNALRTNAIWSLAKHNMAPTGKEQIHDLLTRVFESVAEDAVVRCVAFMTLATWRPSEAWWHTVALHTWHEPSPPVAAFISTAIASIAASDTEMSKTVHRVAHLCRPAAPSTHPLPPLLYLHEYLLSQRVGHRVSVAWVAGVGGSLPQALFLHLHHEMFHALSPLLQTGLQQGGLEEVWRVVGAVLRKARPSPTEPPADPRHRDIVWAMWRELKKQLGLKTLPATSTTLELALAFNRVLLAHTLNLEQQGSSWLGWPMQQMALAQVFTFTRCTTSLALAPTDMGLPLHAQYVSKWAFVVSPRGDLTSGLDLALEYDHSGLLESTTHLPWSRVVVSAGAQQQHHVQAPISLNAHLQPLHRAATVTLRPRDAKEIKVGGHNVLRIGVTEGFPSTPALDMGVYHLHTPDRTPYKVEGAMLPDQLRATYKCESDEPLPATALDTLLVSWFSQPSLTRWSCSLSLALRQDTASITASIMGQTTTPGEDRNVHDSLPAFEAYNIRQASTRRGPRSVQELSQTLSQLQEALEAESGVPVAGVVLNVVLEGAAKGKTRGRPLAKYEAALAWTSSSSPLKASSSNHSYASFADLLPYSSSGPRASPRASPSIASISSAISAFSTSRSSSSTSSPFASPFSLSSSNSSSSSSSPSSAFGIPLSSLSSSSSSSSSPSSAFGIPLSSLSSSSSPSSSSSSFSPSSSSSFPRVALSLLASEGDLLGHSEAPSVACVVAEVRRPPTVSLTLDELTSADLMAELRLEVRGGQGCSSGGAGPLVELVASVDVSGSQREDLTKGCTRGANDDAIAAPRYDYCHVQLAWDEVVEGCPWLLQRVLDSLDQLNTTNATLALDAFRHPEGDWSVWEREGPINVLPVEAPLDTPLVTPLDTSLEGPDAPLASGVAWWTWGLSHLATFVTPNLALGPATPTCTLNPGQVRTFDGLRFPYAPDKCWNTLAIALDVEGRGDGRGEERGEEGGAWAVKVRRIREWEVQVVWAAASLVFDVTKSKVLVNGVAWRSDDPRYNVTGSGVGGHQVSMSEGLTVTVREAVVLTLSQHHDVIGLCGNGDGDRGDDMTGPLTCTYPDAAHLTHAWSSPGGTCTPFTLLMKERTLRLPKRVCGKGEEVPGIPHADQDNCTSWDHETRVEGGVTCRALTPTPLCRPGCSSATNATATVEYECWSTTSHHEEDSEEEEEDELPTTFEDILPFPPPRYSGPPHHTPTRPPPTTTRPVRTTPSPASTTEGPTPRQTNKTRKYTTAQGSTPQPSKSRPSSKSKQATTVDPATSPKQNGTRGTRASKNNKKATKPHTTTEPPKQRRSTTTTPRPHRTRPSQRQSFTTHDSATTTSTTYTRRTYTVTYPASCTHDA